MASLALKMSLLEHSRISEGGGCLRRGCVGGRGGCVGGKRGWRRGRGGGCVGGFVRKVV